MFLCFYAIFVFGRVNVCEITFIDSPQIDEISLKTSCTADKRQEKQFVPLVCVRALQRYPKNGHWAGEKRDLKAIA